ncbi:MAG: HIT domain-containing protein [Actinobacteria bacterium]|nr:HIT domain-containing protein [Actinomycetota bacterium]MBW3649508.1 HIT domain-containing protein [Actinomycetota bacterium]
MERLWAGWRSDYITGSAPPGDPQAQCVFCRILDSGEPDSVTKVVVRKRGVVALLNAFPYTSGHLMVLPERHLGEMEDLDAQEHSVLWRTVTDGVLALKSAYRPEGINLGANLGRAAGAGLPGHLHVHLLPRWVGDTNFTTTVAETRVLPESLDVTWQKLRDAWPTAAG